MNYERKPRQSGQKNKERKALTILVSLINIVMKMHFINDLKGVLNSVSC